VSPCLGGNAYKTSRRPNVEESEKGYLEQLRTALVPFIVQLLNI
jgi:hypothetical protein